MDTSRRAVLSALAHGSVFFTASLVAVGIPLLLLLTATDTVIQENAREALNFQITLLVASVVTTILCFFVVGYLLVPVVALMNIVLPIMAIVAVMRRADEPYAYPVSLPLL